MVVHTFNLSTPEAKAGEPKASLVYTVSCRTARGIQRNPVSKTNKQKANNKMGSSELLSSCFQVTHSADPAISPAPCRFYFHPLNSVQWVFLPFRSWVNRGSLKLSHL